MHSRMIGDYGGVVNPMPWFATLFVLFAMANAGLPGTSGFVGEFMVALAAFQASPWVAAAAALTLILGAAYTLWLVKRVIFGPEASPEVKALGDLRPHEALTLVGFAVFVLLIGVWPAPVVELMDAAVAELIARIGGRGA
ncbi:MAG: NADH-quinone oxidoreductase subunit M, partial [Geminicoccaceae bacterium]|nr:NADH-quinone oxidoreductase subunit M [Geminicoccaceae bacterium]